MSPPRSSRIAMAASCVVAVLALGIAGCGGSTHRVAKRSPRAFVLTHAAPVPKVAPTGAAGGTTLIARYLSFPVPRITRAHALTESSRGQTVPEWGGTATAFGKSYDYLMVGPDPFATNATPNVTIGVDIVPVRFDFLGPSGQVAYTFDPGAANPDCGLATSPTQLLLQSPLFQTHDYVVRGTNLGALQYEDAFLREEFAKQALGPSPPNPGYGVTLDPISQPEIGLKVPYGAWKLMSARQTGACGGRAGGTLGEIDVSTWFGFLQQKLVGQLQSLGETTATHLLDLLLSNVVMPYGSSCCVAGFHSGVSTAAGVQYYVTAVYGPPGRFHGKLGMADIAPMSHEVGEWLNDPDGQNPTPAWGHLGQVPGCQATLEVGDPLSGTVLPVRMPNGVTYHPQELAFLSWFFRQPISTGINGWYSSNGTFTGTQPVCLGATESVTGP